MAESTQSTATPLIPVAKYNLFVIGFFTLILAAQIAVAQQYIRLFPTDLKRLFQTIIVLGFGIQGALLIAVIPLAVVFIYGWLYLSNIQVPVRRLYQVAVLALAPLLVFVVGSLVYLLTLRSLEPEVKTRIVALSSVVQSELTNSSDATKIDPTHLQDLATFVRADITKRWEPIVRLMPVPVALSCLTCGWLLRRRLGLGPIRSYLIPTVFVLSVVFVRWGTAGTSQQLLEKVRSLVQP